MKQECNGNFVPDDINGQIRGIDQWPYRSSATSYSRTEEVVVKFHRRRWWISAELASKFTLVRPRFRSKVTAQNRKRPGFIVTPRSLCIRSFQVRQWAKSGSKCHDFLSFPPVLKFWTQEKNWIKKYPSNTNESWPLPSDFFNQNFKRESGDTEQNYISAFTFFSLCWVKTREIAGFICWIHLTENFSMKRRK